MVSPLRVRPQADLHLGDAMTGLTEDYYPYWIQAQRRPQIAAILAAMQQSGSDELPATGSLLLKAVIIPGSKVAEGTLVKAVALPWFEILDLLKRDPTAAHRIDWRTWEEIIAAAYHQQGFEVVVTPRSGDGGLDIIATSKELGSICFFDQVKAYAPGKLVSADEVRSILGVLTVKPNVSKGLVTTTSDFAPGVWKDPELARLMPYRLELKNRTALIEWLNGIATEKRR